MLWLASALSAESLRFDAAREWQTWPLPLGIVALDAAGVIRPVEIRKNPDPVRDAAAFGGGIHAAGSNAPAAARAKLRFLPGGYGRMTPAYDRRVRAVNRFLAAEGPTAGAVQRLGAGWGGNIGGLVHRAFVDGDRRAAFADMLGAELGYEPTLAAAVPGEGAGLLAAPGGG